MAKVTLSLAWIKKIHDCEELWFASDSRLSGSGKIVDYSPKIFTFARSDCAIAFAGDTDYAYPFVIQLSMAIESYKPAITRSMEIKTLKTHIVKILTTLLQNVKMGVPEYPEVEFIFGGYSWVDKEFKIWNIVIDKENNSFIGNEVTTKKCMGMGKIAFAGDVRPQAKRILYGSLKSDATATRGESLRAVQKVGWDLRPFSVLRDLLRSPEKPYTIGGAPQILKIYQHMNAVPLAVYWPNKDSNRITVMGRPLQDYERTSLWVLDPDTLKGEKPEGRESF